MERNTTTNNGENEMIKISVMKISPLQLLINGKCNGIEITGNTTPIYSFDQINYKLAYQITRIFRSDGTGKEITTSIKLKVINKVFLYLHNYINN